MSFSLKTSKGIPLFVEILFLASPGLRATDCNQNGVKDTLDIASGTSRDCNLNSLPDECDVTPTFKLGAAESFPIERSPDVLTAADMGIVISISSPSAWGSTMVMTLRYSLTTGITPSRSP